MVSSLLSQFGLLHMDELLSARHRAVGPMNIAVDGGAGWGATASVIAQHLTPRGRVFAFEPFPGNHQFFESADPRITLVKAAISDSAGQKEFVVPSVVGPNDQWAQKGLVGYSSLGHLGDGDSLKRKLKAAAGRLLSSRPDKGGQTFLVECVRLDESVDEASIDFVKLDLQGGEFRALKGLGKKLAETDLLWIEFTGDRQVMDHLIDNGFLLFDTNYLCPSSSKSRLGEYGLKARQEVILSTSAPAILASRTVETHDYFRWFKETRRAKVMLQTDLCAVNRKFVDDFLLTLGQLTHARPA